LATGHPPTSTPSARRTGPPGPDRRAQGVRTHPCGQFEPHLTGPPRNDTHHHTFSAHAATAPSVVGLVSCRKTNNPHARPGCTLNHSAVMRRQLPARSGWSAAEKPTTPNRTEPPRRVIDSTARPGAQPTPTTATPDEPDPGRFAPRRGRRRSLLPAVRRCCSVCSRCCSARSGPVTSPVGPCRIDGSTATPSPRLVRLARRARPRAATPAGHPTSQPGQRVN